jgi:hypothetical protein
MKTIDVDKLKERLHGAVAYIIDSLAQESEPIVDDSKRNTFFAKENVHCDYVHCNAGQGLVGMGRCFNKGNAQPGCPQFVDEETWLKEREREQESEPVQSGEKTLEPYSLIYARKAFNRAIEKDESETYNCLAECLDLKDELELYLASMTARLEKAEGYLGVQQEIIREHESHTEKLLSRIEEADAIIKNYYYHYFNINDMDARAHAYLRNVRVWK